MIWVELMRYVGLNDNKMYIYVLSDRDISKHDVTANCYQECHNLRDVTRCDFKFTYQSKPPAESVPNVITTHAPSEDFNSTGAHNSSQELYSNRSVLQYVLYFWMLRTILPNLTMGWT